MTQCTVGALAIQRSEEPTVAQRLIPMTLALSSHRWLSVKFLTLVTQSSMDKIDGEQLFTCLCRKQ